MDTISKNYYKKSDLFNTISLPIDLKQHIDECMNLVMRNILFSGTGVSSQNNWRDFVDENRLKTYEENRHLAKHDISNIKPGKHYPIENVVGALAEKSSGNCHNQAQMIMFFMSEKGHQVELLDSWKIKHTFAVVDVPKSKEKVVLDPWAGKVFLIQEIAEKQFYGQPYDKLNIKENCNNPRL